MTKRYRSRSTTLQHAVGFLSSFVVTLGLLVTVNPFQEAIFQNQRESTVIVPSEPLITQQVNPIQNVVSGQPQCHCVDDEKVSLNELTDHQYQAMESALRGKAETCEGLQHATQLDKAHDSDILAVCAMNYLNAHINALLPPNSSIVMDYGFDGSYYTLPQKTPENWVYLTALLPPSYTKLPEKQTLQKNQLLLAPPTQFRLTSLFVTNSLFDVNIAFRLDALQQFSELSLTALLAKILAMAKTTFIMLPCNKALFVEGEGLSNLSGADVLRKAATLVVSNSTGKLGLHFLDLTVRTLAVFKTKSGSCVRELLQVTPTKIWRGVRLKWCYYPLGTKYDLIYQKGEYIRLVHRYIQQWTRAGGDKVKTIRKWKASINMADVLGWGLTDEQRELLYWDFLTQPSCPDPAIQNWLLTEGGRVIRIDPNQQAIKGLHPTARSYLEFLKIHLCVSEGKGWKQVFGYDSKGKEVGLHHITKKGTAMKYINTKLYRDLNGHLEEVTFSNATVANSYPECPPCNECTEHSWRALKLVWHFGKSLPPPACHECYECQRKRLMDDGVVLMSANGCTDVEGVEEDTEKQTKLCDDTQIDPIPRDSATPAALEKGPY